MAIITKLRTLRVGDAFWHENEAYIAFALTPDPFEVYCLKVNTHELVELDEHDDVELIENWTLRMLSSPTGAARREKLEVLY